MTFEKRGLFLTIISVPEALRHPQTICGCCLCRSKILHPMVNHIDDDDIRQRRWRWRRKQRPTKTKFPTRTYNLIVNHRREILATTHGHPGSFNDKTVMIYDEFITDIKSYNILDEYEFELLERRNGKVVSVKYKGMWIVVDNGYHNWSVTVPPISNSCHRDEIWWSEWLESMRKDVEVNMYPLLLLDFQLHINLTSKAYS